jgi:hypothetical protein
MSNKQQTAVEWYDNQLRKVFSNTTEASNFSHEELLQQAKEMEKEQSIEFAWECQEMFKHEIKEHFEEKFNDRGNK